MFYIIFCNPDMCYSAALECFNLLICRQHPEKHPFFPTFMHLSDVPVKYFVEAYVAHNDQSFLRRLDFIYTHSSLAAPVHQRVQ